MDWCYSSLLKKAKTTSMMLAIFCLTTLNTGFAYSAESDSLTDIAGHQYEDAIRVMVNSGTMPINDGSNLFRPNDLLSLGEQVELLLRAAGLYEQALAYSGGQCPEIPIFSYANSLRIFTTKNCPNQNAKNRRVKNLLATAINALKQTDGGKDLFVATYKSYNGPNISVSRPFGLGKNHYKYAFMMNSLAGLELSSNMSDSGYGDAFVTRGQAAAIVMGMFQITYIAPEPEPEPAADPSLTLLEPINGSQLFGDKFTVKLKAPGFEKFDIALGCPEAPLSTIWISGLTSSEVTLVHDRYKADCANSENIVLRVYAHFLNGEQITGDYSFTRAENVGNLDEGAIPYPSITLMEPADGKQLDSDAFLIKFSAIGANSYDIAAGCPADGLAYGWIGNLQSPEALIGVDRNNAACANSETVKVRVFANYDSVGSISKDYYYVRATIGGNPDPEVDPDPTVPTLTLLQPVDGAQLTSDTFTIKFSAPGADSYDIALGCPEAPLDYGWIGGLSIPESTVTIDRTIAGCANSESIKARLFANYSDSETLIQDYYFVRAAASSGGGDDGSGGTDGNTADFGDLVIWANDGGDKVAQHDLRGSADPTAVNNSIWDGAKIVMFGARNEVVNFNMIMEAASKTVSGIEVSLDQLSGPNGSSIHTTPASGEGLFNYVDRNIELFYIRYLQIQGVSGFLAEKYDQRHLPKRMRMPHSATGGAVSGAGWADRPDHDQYYPDIAVPLELENGFTINQGTNQSVYADIYIPKSAVAGIYTGSVVISQNGNVLGTIPVELNVRNFSLPDVPTTKTMLYVDDYANRYGGSSSELRKVHDRHFQMAHRHKISLIDADISSNGRPSTAWESRLDGSLFTHEQGYDGPGYGQGNGVYSIGTYGGWSWKGAGENAMRTNSDAWVNWFNTNSPDTEYFLYLIDESTDYEQIQTWASYIENNPGPGNELMSMITIGSGSTPTVETPGVDIPTLFMSVGDTDKWNNLSEFYKSNPDKRFYMYNGSRPATGSFMTEDDGVALRQVAWAQYKLGADRWFYWQGTYYNNFQAGMGETNVFQSAHTFGGHSRFDSLLGETGWNYSNGDGVMFYPGTDTVYTQESYGLRGPIASLRLKHWRRGIQDADYLAMAEAIDPERTRQIIQEIVPKVAWEYGVSDPNDPTWIKTAISWSDDPDVWEAARKELADIIDPIQQ